MKPTKFDEEPKLEDAAGLPAAPFRTDSEIIRPGRKAIGQITTAVSRRDA